MEFMEPSENLSVYHYTLPAIVTPPQGGGAAPIPFNWFTDTLSKPVTAGSLLPYHVLAQNVIALVILPKLSKQDAATLTGISSGDPDSALAPYYYYNSAITGEVGTNKALNSRNQLPPVLQVTMVAIDDVSAARKMPKLSDAEDLVKNTLGLSKRFLVASKYHNDLDMHTPGTTSDPSLEDLLIQNKINYRIFSTNVSIRGAKWSRATTK
jgi:uncharacterized protein (TIGR02599 family)